MIKGNLGFAVLGCVARSADGLHGYRLKSEFEALCDDFWEVNYGRVYRVLDELEQDGQLAVATELQERRPTRKVYRITEHGRRTLDDWLLQPISETPQPLRDELSLKLLFLQEKSIDTMHGMLKRQRSIYLTRLARVSRRRTRLEKAGYDSKVTKLVIDGAEMRVRADLTWVDHIERMLTRFF